MRTLAIIPAAGLGRRMGGVKKQFLKIRGRPVISITLEQFELSERIDAILPVVRKEDIGYFHDQIIKNNTFSKISRVAAGGEERQASVRNALNMADEFDIILVHDGVRPFVSVDLINNAVRQAEKYGAVVTAIESKDTLKEVDSDGKVVKTLDRASIFRIQTPQAFKTDILLNAFREAEHSGINANDEASLVEKLGYPVRIIPGNERNIKITTPDDLGIINNFLKP